MGDQSKAFPTGLGDEHAIEWVAMVEGQCAGGLRVALPAVFSCGSFIRHQIKTWVSTRRLFGSGIAHASRVRVGADGTAVRRQVYGLWIFTDGFESGDVAVWSASTL